MKDKVTKRVAEHLKMHLDMPYEGMSSILEGKGPELWIKDIKFEDGCIILELQKENKKPYILKLRPE